MELVSSPKLAFPLACVVLIGTTYYFNRSNVNKVVRKFYRRTRRVRLALKNIIVKYSVKKLSSFLRSFLKLIFTLLELVSLPLSKNAEPIQP